MKKQVFLFSILIILIFSLSCVRADINKSKVDKAYSCLKEKVKDRCSELSLEEKIFSLLAIGECKNEIISDSKNEGCWPDSGCKIKTTAQAILALNKAGVNTDEAEKWLLSQNTTSLDIDWYLEIESPEETTCEITYSGSSYPISIGEDKKMSSNAGSCLSLSEDKWWLKISPACYDTEFEISCDQQFLTTLLFKKTTSSTIYVLEKTSSASAGGTTTEKANSFCFAQGGSCDYEANLWAALVLNYLGEDISFYMPYLITMAEDNSEHLPESFLYFLTGYSEFRQALLDKQKSDKWWSESGDKFYDTALALLPFEYEELQQKSNSEEWLLEVQDKDGCWQGNIRNTAFILYSIWPRDFYVDDDDQEISCNDAGGFCMSSIDCQEAGGVELDYSCSGMFVCCDREKSLESCYERGGEICNLDQICQGGTLEDASDTERCCVGGRCETPSVADCEENFGICRAECEEGEEESLTYTCDYGDVCCVKKTTPKKKNHLWIWILLILIALVILGIVFKDKLRHFWFRTKSKFGKSKPRRPPGFSSAPLRVRPRTQRRILPPVHRQLVRRPPIKKPKGELDEVLRKLKEMGK